MKRQFMVVVAALLLTAIPALAEELKIGAGAAPTENILKPVETPFEKATGLDLTIVASGPKQAVADLERGTVDAAAAGLAFNDWLELLKKENVAIADVAAYQPVVIGKDRVIVIVHNDNPVAKLSKEQLTGIFTGTISNWKEVGGLDAPVLVVWGGLIQGTNAMFIKHIMGGAKPTTEVIAATTAEDIRQNVSANPEAVGIGPHSILNSTVRSPETPELSRPITLITKGAPSEKVKKLIEFIKAEGKTYIKD